MIKFYFSLLFPSSLKLKKALILILALICSDAVCFADIIESTGTENNIIINSTNHYRTTGVAGSWSNILVWETSPTGVGNWSPAATAPDETANTIEIRANHTVSINSAVRFDQLIVNGTLQLINGGTFTIIDGTGDDLTINNGGKLIISKTGGTISVDGYNNSVNAGTSQVRVKTGGLISVSAAAGPNARDYESFATNANNIWEDKSTYDHSSASTNLSLTGGIEFFRGALPGAIPTFRINATENGLFTSSSIITIKGLTEVNTSLTIDGSGTKNFNNGISGSGTITTVVSGSGNSMNIPSSTAIMPSPFAIIGGTLNFVVNKTINITDNVEVPSSSVISVSNSSIYVATFAMLSGAKLNVNNGAIFDIGSNAVISGATGLLQIDGIFKTSNSSGFTASRSTASYVLNSGSTVEFNGTNQSVGVENFYNLTFSNSGNKISTSTQGINMQNGGALTLSGSVIVDATQGQIGPITANNISLFMSGNSRLILRSNNRQLPNMEGTYSLSGTSVIEFAGSGQTIRGNSSIAYANIDVSGADVRNSGGFININANGIFSVKSGGTFTLNAQKISPFSNSLGQAIVVENNGKFNVGLPEGFNGGPNTAIASPITNITLHPNSVVDYVRAGDQIITNANSLFYGNLTLSGSGIKTAPSGVLELRGNFSNAVSATNTFAHNNGTVAFVGNSTQNYFSGANGTSFYKLENRNATGSLVMNAKATIENELNLSVAAARMTLNGDLTLKSSAASTAAVARITAASDPFSYGTGSFVVERYLPGFRAWRLLSAPVQNTSTPSIFDSWQESGLSIANYGTQISSDLYNSGANGFDYHTQFPALKIWDPALNNYVPITNTKTTKIGNAQGYYVFVRGDRTVGPTLGLGSSTTLRAKGKINVLTQPVVNAPAMKFITIGNPYPSRIAFSSITKTGIADGFTVWNPSLYGAYGVGGFEAYSKNSNGDYETATKPGIARNFIESGEAIFVQNNSTINGTVSIAETAKGTGSAVVSRNGSRDASLRILLHTNDATGADYIATAALINFDESYSNGLDNDDFRKFQNSTENITVVNGSFLLEVERRKMVTEADTIFLSITRTQAKPYTLQLLTGDIIAPGLVAFLVDRFTNTQTPISLDGSTNYPFVVNSDAGSSAANRFFIIFKQSIVLPVNFVSIDANRNADKTVTVSWKVENETSIQDYVIGHSADGINFQNVGTVQALNNGTTSYQFNHTAASAKVNFYRIHSIDLITTSKLSATAKVNALPDGSTVQIVPNPVRNGIINLQTKLAEGKYALQLIDSKGTIIFSGSITQSSTNANNTFRVGNVALGIYQLLIIDIENKIISTKVVMK